MSFKGPTLVQLTGASAHGLVPIRPETVKIELRQLIWLDGQKKNSWLIILILDTGSNFGRLDRAQKSVGYRLE